MSYLNIFLNQYLKIYNSLIVNNKSTLYISILIALFGIAQTNIEYSDDLKKKLNNKWIKYPILFPILYILNDNFTLGLSMIIMYIMVILKI
jgi:hypothetical protein